ncbi:MAG: sialidase family protein [bacterium]
MRPIPLFLSGLLVAVVLAGCTESSTPPTSGPTAPADTIATLPGFTPLARSLLPTFAAPTLIDDVRAGGEPVIAVTHKGTILVGSHPGFTHYHPGSDPAAVTDLVGPFGGQSYIFRSTDNGTTWQPIGAPMGMGMGPRGAGFGVSDPEFTVMEDGTICFTDLEALAAASTSCSIDDGQTWLTANPASSGGPVDRQWLSSYKDEFYFTGSGAKFRASKDRGVTWEDRGDEACGSDVVANPANGHLYQSCDGYAMAVSTDGGRLWSRPLGPKDAQGSGLALNEPAVDSAGNVWLAWADNEKTLHLAGTPDEGSTWPWELDLTPHFRLFSATASHAASGLAGPSFSGNMTAYPATNGTYVWPWVSAGSAGRLSVTWIGAYEEQPSESNDGPWYTFTAFVINATSPHPTVVVSQLTPTPMHDGPICQGGTGCEVGSVQGEAGSDRRLGDFFETTVEPGTGYLLATWSNTAAHPSDVIGHPQFVRQTGGIRLIADDELARFRPTQG